MAASSSAPSESAAGTPAGGAPSPDFGLWASGLGAQALQAARTEIPGGLAALEERVAHDLTCLNYPPPDWVPPRVGPDAQAMQDAVVVGGGMCGQTAAYALRREGIHRVLTVDARKAGLEGPWATFARMEMLRSPKHLTGPDLGLPSLTFRAWYEARFGVAAWAALHKVWRLDWRDYLLWVRQQVGVSVQGETTVTALEPMPEGIAVQMHTPVGPRRVCARTVVLAQGREGSGRPRWPSFPSFDPHTAVSPQRVRHSMDPVDPARWTGARIGVLGVGASAFDNAARALEAGAAEVTMFARRAQLPQVNKSKWTSFIGFFRGYATLPDAERVRFYAHVFDEQVPPPFESVLRCDRHPGFALRLGEPWLDLRADDQGVTVVTPAGTQRFDEVILGTGFDVDLLDVPVLGSLAAQALRWGDRLAFEDSPVGRELARFPYLDAGFAMQAQPGADPTVAQALARIRLFGWGSTLSHGALAGDIPGLAIGATRLSAAIAQALFVEDAARHHRRLLDHAEQELKPTRWWTGGEGPGPAGTQPAPRAKATR